MVCLWSYHLYVQSQSTMKNYTRLNGWSACGVITYMSIIIIIIINPLTVRVVGAPQMILQPVFSIFPCSLGGGGGGRDQGIKVQLLINHALLI